ncbi:unnamed protein product, partial [Symbiodinium sp. CCMP2592]
ALGIPFTAVAAAEKQPEYRRVIQANHGSRLQHLYETLEDMLEGRPCTKHADCEHCRIDAVGNISLALTGSPCNPFSKQRAKRFRDQSVQLHHMTETTMSGVVGLYRKWEPRAAIMEQVRGFDMKTSQADLEFLKTMASQTWKHGGYWVAKLLLDASDWIHISRPRTAAGHVPPSQQSDMADGPAAANLDVSSLIDGLLDVDALDEADGCDSQPDDVAAQLVPAQPRSLEADELMGLVDDLMPAVPEESFRPAANPDLRDIFGPRAALSQLGGCFQKQIFQRYCAATAGHPHQRPKLRKAVVAVTDCLVRSAKHWSMTVVQDVSDTSRRSLQRTLLQLAAALLHGGCWLVGAMLGMCSRWFKFNRMQPVMAVSKFRYDETPLRMRLHEVQQFIPDFVDRDGHLKESYKYIKILRIDWTIGLLMYDLATCGHRLMTVDVPVTMVPLERTTAETQAAAIQAAMDRVPDLDRQLSVYPEQVRLACIDRYAANLKAEDSFKCSQPKMIRTIFPCDVHKASAVIQKSLRPFEEVTSGLVHTGLSMEGGGSLAVLRQVLQDVFEKELIVEHSPAPGGSIRNHTRQILDLFCPVHPGASSPLKNQQRQFILQYYCNSDITQDRIVHHCSFSCCSSRQETADRFATTVVLAFLPRKCPMLKRKSWTDAEQSMEWAGLLQSFWCLFTKIMVKFTGSATAAPVANASRDDEDEAENFAEAAHPDAAATDVLELVDGILAQGSGVGEAETGDHDEAAAPVLPDGEVDWHELQLRRKRKAGVFACRASLMERLVCARHVAEPTRKLMGRLLQISGEEWETQQQRQAQRGEPRTYRLLESARGNLVDQVVQDIRAMLPDIPAGLPVCCHTRRARGLFFAGLSAALCNLDLYLGRAHRGFPYALFRAVDTSTSDADKQKLLDRPPCMRDEFSDKFLKKHNTPAAMSSQRARAVLETVCLLADTDVAQVEAGHAAVRDFTLQKGRGHVPTLSEVSAKSLCRWINKHHGKPTESAKKEKVPKRRRAISAYVAFLSEKMRGQRFHGSSQRAFAQEYRQLTPDEREKWREEALRLTLVKRYAAEESQLQVVPLRASLGNMTVAEVLQTDCLVTQMPASNFQGRLRAFCDKVNADARAAREAAASKKVPVRPGFDLVERDAGLANAMVRYGGEGILDGAMEIPMPLGSHLTRYCWRMPVLPLAEDVLANAGLEAGGIALPAFEDRWQKDHNIVQHDKQQPIQVDKTKLFQEEPCLKLGFCVCKKEQHQKMNKALIQAMKTFFQKVNKVATPQRRLLEDWRVVLHLCSVGGAEESTELFLHLGASNLRTWEFVCLRLEEDAREETCLTLRVCGCDATEVLEVKSLLHFLATYLDPNRPCRAHFMKVCSDGKAVAVDRMMPMYVDVESLQPPVQFWNGPSRKRPAAPMEEHGRDEEEEKEDEDMLPDEEAAQQDNDESDKEQELNDSDLDMDLDEVYAFAEEAAQANLQAEDAGSDDDEDLWRALDDLVAVQAAAGDGGEGGQLQPGGGEEPEVPRAADDGARPGRRPRREASHPDDPRPARAPAAGRAPRQAEIVFDMKDFGLDAEIRFNAKGFLRAHCKCPGHGQSCRRQRQTTAGRAGAGRPVGSLITWLRSADQASNQAEHVAMGTETHAARSEARAWFEGLAGSNVILDLERPRGPQEPAEPRTLP